MPAKIEIEVLGDIGSLERKLAKAQADLSRFKAQAETNATGIAAANTRAGSSFAVLGGKSDGLLKSLKSPGGAFAGGLVASAALSQLKSAIDAASDLNEQMAKSGEVFGESARNVDNWAQTMASAFGISRVEATEAASTYGLLFRNLGVGETAAVGLSKTLVELAGDLASFNNTSVEQALNAIRSGLSGEIEPLRKYGVFLNEARTKVQALADTGKENARSLTTQDKVLARYNLLLKDTSLAQGDAARTAGSFANQSRQLSAQAADLQANLGTLLLPVVTELVTFLNDAAAGALLFGDALGKLADIDLGPLGEVRDVFRDIKNIAIDNASPFIRPLVRTIDHFAGDDDPKKPVRPDAAGPGRGIGLDLARKDAARVRREERTRAFRTDLPVGAQNALLKAENENDQSAFLKGLIESRRFFEAQLKKAQAADDSKAVNKIRQNLEGVQSAITGVYANINSGAQEARDAVKQAAAKAKAAAEKAKSERERLLAETAANLRQELSDQETLLQTQLVKDGATDAERKKLIAFYRRQAQSKKLTRPERLDYAAQLVAAVEDLETTVANRLKAQSKRLKDQAAKFKNAVLDRLDRRQGNLETNRALADAQKAYELSLKINGKQFSTTAFRNLEDARLDRKRFVAENATYTTAASGATTVTMNGVTVVANNPQQLLKALEKLGKGNAAQSRGRNPGGIYGIPR